MGAKKQRSANVKLKPETFQFWDADGSEIVPKRERTVEDWMNVRVSTLFDEMFHGACVDGDAQAQGSEGEGARA